MSSEWKYIMIYTGMSSEWKYIMIYTGMSSEWKYIISLCTSTQKICQHKPQRYPIIRAEPAELSNDTRVTCSVHSCVHMNI